MTDIYEEKPLLVHVRSVNGDAGAENVKFQFFKDGEQFVEVEAKTPSKKVLADKGWLEATCTPPKVDGDKQSYQLTYKATFDGEEKKDFPEFIVWPKTATLKVIRNRDPDKDSGFKKFKFVVKQGGEKQGETKTISEASGIYEFDLKKGVGFSVEAEHPYKFIAPPIKEVGRAREHKGELDFQAEFITPKELAIKQWVNMAPPDLTVGNLGQDKIGPTVIIKVGVKGDLDLPSGEKLGAEGMLVHFRVTFGPNADKKSTRDDPAYKTEIKSELDVDTLDDSAKPVYTGKLKLTADGNAEMKVYLGLAGLDTCKVEIAGSDRFINEDPIDADAIITFTNWRKMYYEIMAPDFYRDRELDDRVDNDKVGAEKNHIDFPAAALAKLKALGDSVGNKYEFEAAHIFPKAKAPVGNVLSKRFLEIDGSEDDAYILTDYTMEVLPTDTDWAKTKINKSNYIKLCDANYYWEREWNDAAGTHAGFPSGRARFFNDVHTATPTVDVDALGGHFIPFSGEGASTGGAGRISFFMPDGAEGIKWEAMLNPDHFKTTVEAIANNRPVGAKAKSRVITITESNQNPAACDITYVKPGKLSNVPTSLSAEQKNVIDAWITPLFEADALRNNDNKISVTIRAESGSARREDRFTKLKTYVQAKLDELKLAKTIKVHPALDNAGDPRKGVLLLADIDMTTSTRNKMEIILPSANPEDPGSFVGAAETATECPVELDTYIELHEEGLGLCDDADVLSVFSKANAAIDICTAVHELGHSYGMAVFNGEDTPPKNMTMPKKYDENEVALYKHNGDKGHVYTEHEHSGSHCAYGLSDAQKAGADYQAAGYGAAAKCVMFGSGGYNRNLCPQCVDLFRGANLTSIPVAKGS